MSSDNDLFGSDTDESGNDTDDLINTARSQAPVKKKLGAAAKKKSNGGGGGRLQKKGGAKNVPDADNDDSDDDDSLDGGSGGKPMSKKERMEALAKARRGDSTDGGATAGEKSERRKKRSAGGDKGSGGGVAGDGYPSDAESVDSAEFQRTKEDDDFIDASGEDPEALRELYREQHFDDEEAEEDDMEERPRKSMGGGGKRGKRKVNWNPDSDIRRSASKTKKDADGNEVEPDNPIMAAVHKMKKKKKEVKKLSDLEEESKDIVMQMLEAADEDDKAIEERRPALHKLQYLNKLLEVMALKEMSRPLLDNDFLAAAGRWIQPLKNGKLGNVTVRNQMLHGIHQHFSGGKEKGINSNDLKRSGFGKVCMSLYMHPNETPELKRFLKQLIEQWSRPIFSKSGNMKDLEKAQRERRYMMPPQQMSQSLSSPQQHAAAASVDAAGGNRSVVGLSTILAKGKSSTGTGGGARVRVPYSRGFQFTVRPEAKTSITEDVVKTAKQNSTITERREGLNKRMVDKGRFKTSGKNMRSANISVEGRRMK